MDLFQHFNARCASGVEGSTIAQASSRVRIDTSVKKTVQVYIP